MSESIKINRTTLTFNKIWYVSTTGNDSTNNGSKASPYKTISKVCSVATSGDAVYVYEGTYPLDQYTTGNYSLTIIGENLNTVVNFTFAPVYTNLGYYTPFNQSINYYRCRITDAKVATGAAYCSTTFYNCIFNMQLSYSEGVKGLTYINCLFLTYQLNLCTYQNQSVRGPWLYVYMDNCAFEKGLPTSSYNGYAVTQVMFRNNNNYVINATCDSQYKLTIDDTTWLNKGDTSINNPDGNRSSIGIYGGPYAFGVWPSSVLTVNSITPRHLYSLKQTEFSANINAIDETTSTQLQFKIMNGLNELSPLSLDNNRSNISGVLSNNDQIKAIASDNGAITLDIIREPLYRLSSERTFLKIDGGYIIPDQIDRSNNKLELPDAKKIYTNVTNIDLLKYNKRILLEEVSLLGTQLKTPEPGWKRIDNTSFTSNDAQQIDYNVPSGGYYFLKDAGKYATKQFYSTRVRLICIVANTATNPDPGGTFNVTIDGVTETCSTLAPLQYQTLVYQKTGLSNDKHTITITNPTGGFYIWFDAMDIDESGSIV